MTHLSPLSLSLSSFSTLSHLFLSLISFTTTFLQTHQSTTTFSTRNHLPHSLSHTLSYLSFFIVYLVSFLLLSCRSPRPHHHIPHFSGHHPQPPDFVGVFLHRRRSSSICFHLPDHLPLAFRRAMTLDEHSSVAASPSSSSPAVGSFPQNQRRCPAAADSPPSLSLPQRNHSTSRPSYPPSSSSVADDNTTHQTLKFNLFANLQITP